jgi:hypothetical protein
MEVLEQLLDADPNVSENDRAFLTPPEELAQRIFDALPRRSEWDAIVGPVYASKQLEKFLDVSRQAISDRLKRHTLLGLRTSDGYVVYPSFQFVGSTVVPGLATVLRETAGHVDEWTLASWLRATQPELGCSVMEHLQTRGHDEALRLCVSHAIARWSR